MWAVLEFMSARTYAKCHWNSESRWLRSAVMCAVLRLLNNPTCSVRCVPNKPLYTLHTPKQSQIETTKAEWQLQMLAHRVNVRNLVRAHTHTHTHTLSEGNKNQQITNVDTNAPGGTVGTSLQHPHQRSKNAGAQTTHTHTHTLPEQDQKPNPLKITDRQALIRTARQATIIKQTAVVVPIGFRRATRGSVGPGSTDAWVVNGQCHTGTTRTMSWGLVQGPRVSCSGDGLRPIP